MSSLVKGINKILKDINAAHYFVAISSGKDSVALASVVHSLGYPMTLLHVNYHIRGSESNDDQLWIEEFARSINSPLKVFDVKKDLNDLKKGNLQEIARKIRYQFFETELQKVKNSRILVGHNQLDQLENFWIHLFRNSGRSGLKGMSIENNNILRPMLNFHPSQIIDYLKKSKIEWREDSSNSKTIYLRNFLRHELMPILKGKYPNLEKSIIKIQDKFNEAEVQDQLDLNAYFQQSHFKFYLESLSTFTDEKLILFLKKFNLRGSQLVSFKKFLNAQTGTKFEINSTHFLSKERTYIAFLERNEGLTKHYINCEEVDSLPSFFTKNVLYVSKNKLKGNLQIRYWKKGDRILPLGIKGSKLISDIFINAKISNTSKNTIPIIVDEEHILWCYGLCIDRRKIATIDDKEILKITIQE